MIIDGGKTILELTEYIPCQFDSGAISEPLGETLWRKYSNQVAVEFPSPKTNGKWQFTSQGWVGHIPCSENLALALRPRIDLGNLFRMLEYAYRLESFYFLDGLVDCSSLEEFYERLAMVLSKRVLDRGRKGFYRAYLPESGRLPFIRGRVNIRRHIQSPWDVNVHCQYEDHTPDIEENQILLWTLFRIAHSGMCSPKALPTVRRSYHSLKGLTSVKPFKPRDCIARLYNRLNNDYRPLHALCRFFLENSGPTQDFGDRAMLPFLVNMARLYELFVSEWLKAHLPAGIMLRIQEKVEVGEVCALIFKIDLVLYEADTGKALCVLDTKYKIPESPANKDINQIVTYAEMKGCTEGILVYPVPLAKPLDAFFGHIRVRSISFSLSGDLEEAGQAFRAQLQDIVGNVLV